MFDRRLPFRNKEAVEDDPIVQRFDYDSENESAERDLSPDPEEDFHRMMHRAYLFGKARDPEAAQAQAVRRPQIEAPSTSAHPTASSASHTQPSTHQQTSS